MGVVDEGRRVAAVEFEVLYVEKSIAGGRWKPDPYPTNEEGNEV